MANLTQKNGASGGFSLPLAASAVRFRQSRPTVLPQGAFPTLYGALDVAIILAAAVLADILYHDLSGTGLPDVQISLGLGVVAALIFAGVTHAMGVYGNLRAWRLRRHLQSAVTVWSAAVAGLVLILFLMKMGEAVSRGGLVSFYLLGLAGLSAWRVVLKRLHARLLVAGTVAGPSVVAIAELGRPDVDGQLARMERYGYRLSRLFFVEAAGGPTAQDRVDRSLAAAVRHIRERRVDEVVVLASWSAPGFVESVAAALKTVPVPVKLVADADLQRLMSYSACDIGAARGLVLKPAPLSAWQLARKRAFDIVGSTLLLIALTPVLLIVAAAIKLDSPGPVLFRQWRGGYSGRRFRIFKFRTMSVQEDGEVVTQASRHDQRVTRVGRILRKTSLDEIPQLFNVLAGDMSLVGPRPHAIAHDAAYARIIAPYPERHNVKPGITGWAQVSGCRGETSDPALMAARVEHDIAYIRRWSLLFDISIILRTVREVVLPRRAY